MARGTTPVDPKRLTPRDRINTITHLAETVRENVKHARVHAHEIAIQAQSPRQRQTPLAGTIAHNAQHAAKHMAEVEEHAQKLLDHLNRYPNCEAAMADLQGMRSRKVGPPGRRGKV